MKTADGVMRAACRQQYLKLFTGRPLLMLPTALEAMLSMEISPPLDKVRTDALSPTIVEPSAQGTGGPRIAVIPVSGVMAYHSDWLTYYFDITTYEDIKGMYIKALNDSSINGILFSVDSAGGIVDGLFDLVDAVYAGRSKKPICGVADEMAFSGGYALLSACEKVYVPRTGQVGSIGAIMGHMDQSGYDEKTGLKYSFIISGDRKNDFSSHVPLSPEALAIGQKRVDETRALFSQTVARNRNMKESAVLATEAAIYSGAEAVAAGLADGIMNIDDVLALMTQTIANNTNFFTGGKGMAFADDLKVLLAQGGADAAPALAGEGYVPQSTLAAEQARTAAAQGEGRSAGETAERVRVTGIMDACTLAGMPGEAAGLIKEGCTVEAASTKLVELRASNNGGQQTVINSTVSATTTGENALVDDAKRRANEGR